MQNGIDVKVRIRFQEDGERGAQCLALEDVVNPLDTRRRDAVDVRHRHFRVCLRTLDHLRRTNNCRFICGAKQQDLCPSSGRRLRCRKSTCGVCTGDGVGQETAEGQNMVRDGDSWVAAADLI